MMKSAGSCLFTVNSADQSITPYSQGANGQLVTVTTGKIATSASNISSINGNGTYIILTDIGANQIIPYSIGSSCNLSVSLGGATANQPGTSNPVYSLIVTGSSNTYLYVLNQSTTSTTVNQPYSSITGFLIQSGTSLANSFLLGSPYQVQAAPVCMVEDPTNKYVYVSNRDPGAVTGKLFDPTTGELSELSRGSNFSATGLASCLAISGAVD
jgi:hypothetical protein